MAEEIYRGPTPSGGVLIKAFFTDDQGRSVPKEKATKFELFEYDESGKLLLRATGDIERKGIVKVSGAS